MITGHDIVCIAEADFDIVAWLNVQPMMTRFAKAGNRVLYVESLGLRVPHLSHAADLRKIFRRIRRLFEGTRPRLANLWVLAPRVIPGHHIPWIRKLNAWLLRSQIRSAMRRLKMNDPIYWVYLPTGQPLVGTLGEKATVYYCVDDYLANPGVPVKELKVMEDALAASSNGIMVTAPHLLKKFETFKKPLTCIPNGADIELYRAERTPHEPADLKSIAHPRIGFVGNLTAYKMDFDLLDKVIQSRPQFQFVFLGALGAGDPSTREPAFLKYPNVHWLGEKPTIEVPAYLPHWDVGLIPYRKSAATDAVFPIKFFEYLAAGLPVVATPLPSLQPYPLFCAVSDNPSDFAAVLDQAVKNRHQNVDERRALAAQNSWDVRAESASKFISDLL